MFKKKKNSNDSNFQDIEKIKNHTAKTIEKVHEYAFVLFEIIVYIIVDRIFLSRILIEYDWFSTIWCEVVRAIAFGLGYLVIFYAVKKFYNWLIIKRHPKLNIAGEWYHVHIPNKLGESSATKEPISAGIVQITRELNDFTFNASNYKYTVEDKKIIQIGTEATTTWCTETSEICDSNEFHIVEVYKATSENEQLVRVDKCPVCNERFPSPKDIAEATKNRYGIHLYRIVDRNKIICTYSDCWPSLKSGKLYLYRNIDDRDKKIIEYFKETNN